MIPMFYSIGIFLSVSTKSTCLPIKLASNNFILGQNKAMKIIILGFRRNNLLKKRKSKKLIKKEGKNI